MSEATIRSLASLIDCEYHGLQVGTLVGGDSADLKCSVCYHVKREKELTRNYCKRNDDDLHDCTADAQRFCIFCDDSISGGALHCRHYHYRGTLHKHPHGCTSEAAIANCEGKQK